MIVGKGKVYYCTIYVIIAIKTRNSYLKVKSNITCPVKVGHPPAPATPHPFLSAVSRPPHDCPHYPLQPPNIHCAAIYFFLCANRKVIYLNFLTNSHSNFILLYYLYRVYIFPNIFIVKSNENVLDWVAFNIFNVALVYGTYFYIVHYLP